MKAKRLLSVALAAALMVTLVRVNSGPPSAYEGENVQAEADDGDGTDTQILAQETDDSHNVRVYDPESPEPLNGVSPGSINDATSKFVDALSKFTSDTKDLEKIPAILERFGGITSAVSGGIVVLQMCGILKDPTSEALDNILNELHDIEDTLKSMDAKLDDILAKLTTIELELKEDDLANKTNTYQVRWNTFNTNYVEPLQHYYDEYKGYINRALGSRLFQETGKLCLLTTVSACLQNI